MYRRVLAFHVPKTISIIDFAVGLDMIVLTKQPGSIGVYINETISAVEFDLVEHKAGADLITSYTKKVQLLLGLVFTLSRSQLSSSLGLIIDAKINSKGVWTLEVTNTSASLARGMLII